MSALVALAVAGCGAAGNQQKLHLTSEKRLLSLVARARVDASRHNGTAVHAVLGEFVSEVDTLRTSGQLSHATANNLTGEARATAGAASRQLHATHRARADGAKHHPKTQPPAATTGSQGDQGGGGDGGD